MDMRDLVTDIRTISDEDLKKQVIAIRYRRSIERPAAKRYVKKAKDKKARKATSAIEKLFARMSQDEKDKIIKLLEG